MIWPLILGPLLAVGALGLIREFVALRRPRLASRIQGSMSGFRSKRPVHDLSFELILGQIMQVYRRLVSDRAGMREHRRRVLFELPDHLDLLAAALSSGLNFYSSLSLVNSRTSGLLSDELAICLRGLSVGSTQEKELGSLARRVKVRQVEEFCNRVLLSSRRGTPLAKTLRDQAQAVRAEIRNEILARAGQNETRMLIPLVFLILPVTILFAVYPSLQLFNLSYF